MDPLSPLTRPAVTDPPLAEPQFAVSELLGDVR
jgi:hypothetical protein